MPTTKPPKRTTREDLARTAPAAAEHCWCRTGPVLYAAFRAERLVTLERRHYRGCPMPAVPVDIEAVLFTGGNQREIAGWMGIVNYDPDSRCIDIATLEGTMTAQPGDWIIRGVKGEHYPIKDAIFEATYEPVEPDQQPSDLAREVADHQRKLRDRIRPQGRP